jgi:hypothetical protein
MDNSGCFSSHVRLADWSLQQGGHGSSDVQLASCAFSMAGSVAHAYSYKYKNHQKWSRSEFQDT